MDKEVMCTNTEEYYQSQKEENSSICNNMDSPW